ncbi:MAG TPA: hypothetical protein VFE96_03745 [Candidatus Bathyarchaeia archaeon]|jgi:hypothetical protein|nr:hypothetical protein [Candidatus Bathyarchaeia archaeon]
MLFQSRSAIKVAASAPLIVLAFAAFVGTPVHAYGVAQWQVNFSFNCNGTNACSGFGFWGWCDFGGSASDGLSGTSGDCQIENYNFDGAFGIPAFTPFHVSQDIHSWHIATGSVDLPHGVAGFFADSGTVEFTGTGASGLGLPTGTPIDFVPLCSHGLFFLCDTGIPAAPGHYTLNVIPLFGLSQQPGIHYKIQVNQLP